MQASLVAENERLLLGVVHRLLIAVASLVVGFPGSSAGKESACNVGDSGSIPEKIFPGKTPHAAEQLSLCATTMEPAL